MRLKLGPIMVWSVIVAAGSLRASDVNAQEETYATRLSTVPISAAERNTITGDGVAQAVLDGRELSISGTFQGLQGSASTAALHVSPATGVRGPAILELSVTEATSGTLSATLDLSRDQVQALRDGRVYIQVHSQAAPDGNLWGWLLQ